MLKMELRRVAENIRRAETEDLLDRVTVYRAGMEPVALDLMEGELDRRGVTREQIAEHDADRRAVAIMLPDGTALRCSFCDRPAVGQGWWWWRAFGLLPLVPRRVKFCDQHRSRHPKPPESGPKLG